MQHGWNKEGIYLHSRLTNIVRTAKIRFCKKKLMILFDKNVDAKT